MTRAEFQVLYEQGPDALYALFQQMEQTIAALSARVQALEDQLRKDSHNSSKPPSSDGYKKKPVSLRQPSGKKSGGQPGHPGTTLCLSDDPDTTLQHAPETCSFCAASLANAPVGGYERRQVVDLPPLALQVTEHRALCKRCPRCHKRNTGVFPKGVTDSVQYGPKVKGLVAYLHTYQMLPDERLCELLFDLFGACPSEGTLHNWLDSAFETLAPVETAIKAALSTSAVVGFDETGERIAGKLHWLHSASTERLTAYFPHTKRGTKAMDDAGILPGFFGVAVHDAFSPYFGYTGCEHALCNAHLLRELTFVKGLPRQSWSCGVLNLLIEIKEAVDDAKANGRSHLAPEVRDAFRRRYDRRVRDGLFDNPRAEPTGRKGRPRQSAAHNLALRLKVHKDEVLRFMDRFDVPFDNNQSERDLRMMKVKQKVSGCFRSQRGAAVFCRLRGYIATLRKQRIPLLTALQSIFEGQPRMPEFSG